MFFHRFFTRSALALIVLFAVLLSVGCSMEDGGRENTGFIPSGNWESGFDSYTITNTHVDYFMGGSEYDGVVYPDTILKGSIEKAVDFSDNAGVIIIKVSEATSNTVGMYTGVYYRDYANSAIKLATAIGSEPDYAPVEADSLSAALSLFTSGNVSTHVSFWGSGYTK